VATTGRRRTRTDPPDGAGPQRHIDEPTAAPFAGLRRGELELAALGFELPRDGGHPSSGHQQPGLGLVDRECQVFGCQLWPACPNLSRAETLDRDPEAAQRRLGRILEPAGSMSKPERAGRHE